MRKKLKSARGFTLAELLIVVAIIGVLVAIAIPIFTSQLEKSREAVDLSDVRSAYAEVMMAAITGDTNATYTKDNSQIYNKNDGTYSITVTPLKQQKNDWQTPLPITIGGVSSNASEKYWKGIPGPRGFCKITYHPAANGEDEYVSFYWTGGTDSGDNGTITTPVPTQPIPPAETITPTPDDTITDVDSVINKWGSCEWPSQPSVGTRVIYAPFGQLIKYQDDYYVVANNTKGYYTAEVSTSWFHTPAKAGGEVIPLSGNICKWNPNDSGNTVTGSGGDIYIVDGNAYVLKYSMTCLIPSGENYDKERWVKIEPSMSSIWYEKNS